MRSLLPLLAVLCLSLGTICPFSGKAQTLSRTDRFFIEKGIQFQAWMSSAKSLAGRPTTFHPNRMGRYVRVQLNYWGRQSLTIAEVEVLSNGENVALGKNASQISTRLNDDGVPIEPASLAVDGNTTTTTRTSFADEVRQQWWDVDLGQMYPIDAIRLWNVPSDRGDSINLSDYYVFVGNNPFPDEPVENILAISEFSHYSQAESVRRFAVGEEWENLHFTGPTWYEPSMYNDDFFEEHPNSQWSLAIAPYGTWKMNREPRTLEENDGFLTPQQYAKIDNLTTIAFGDEEIMKPSCDPNKPVTDNLIDRYEEWFTLSREKYPNALVHSNQWPDFWLEEDLRTYTRQAKPDMLTFDRYVFRPALTNCPFTDDSVGYAGGSLYRTFNYLGMYRRLALEGHDGSGRTPIAFGQYLQGIRLGGYVISESQLMAHGFATLLMGGKWMSVWRYELDHELPGNKNFWILPNGELSPRYYQYSRLARQVKKLSPHLSRLVSTDVRIVQGKHLQGAAEVANIRPEDIQAWSPEADPYITSISAVNPESGTNNGLAGDVYIGYFKPVNGIAAAPGITMAPVPHEEAKYFMVLNGLTKANGCCGNGADTTLGTSYRTRQYITFNIDFGDNPVDSLFRVNKFSGTTKKVTLTPGPGNTYSFKDTLPGGHANLYYWENAHNSAFKNLALGKEATQSSNQFEGDDERKGYAEKAVDGNTNGSFFGGKSVTHTEAENGVQAWWQVDLGSLADISSIEVYNRTDDCCDERLRNYHVFVSDSPITGSTVSEIQALPGVSDFFEEATPYHMAAITIGRSGRYVRIQLEGGDALSLAEVRVIGKQSNFALNKPVSQSTNLDIPAGYAEKAVDGNFDGNFFNGSVTHTKAIAGEQSWWQVDLLGLIDIQDITIYNRTDGAQCRLDKFYVFVSETPFTGNSVAEIQSQPGVKEFLFERMANEDTIPRSINEIGRYLRIQLYEAAERLSLAEVVVAGNALNVARGGAVSQSTNLDAVKGHAELAIDGNTDGTYSRGSVTHTNSVSGQQSWWQIDLTDIVDIRSINIFNRADCCFERLEKFHVFVSEAPFSGNTVSEIQSQPGVVDIFHAGTAGRLTNLPVNSSGRYVRIQLQETDTPLSLAEVQIFGKPEEPDEPLLKSAGRQSADTVPADPLKMVTHVNMYPNPAGSMVSLEFKLDDASPVSIVIHDMTGKTIWEEEYQLGEGDHTLRFPMAGSMPGVYIVEVKTRSWKESLRLIVN